MKVSRATYRALLQIDVRAVSALRLLDGRARADLQSSFALQQAVHQQVHALTEAARRVQDHHTSLLSAFTDDLARLQRHPIDWDTLHAVVPRISAGVTTILREVEQPRWTPLGLRHRRRRQLGRDGKTQ